MKRMRSSLVPDGRYMCFLQFFKVYWNFVKEKNKYENTSWNPESEFETIFAFCIDHRKLNINCKNKVCKQMKKSS